MKKLLTENVATEIDFIGKAPNLNPSASDKAKFDVEHTSPRDGGASGDPDCIITYTHYYSWMFVPTTRNLFKEMAGWQDGEHFCTGRDGTTNKSTWGLVSLDAGDCLGQLQVKDG